MRTAILIDGNYYLRRAGKLWGDSGPEDRADELYEYALSHITTRRDARIESGKRQLYRIFYYDCRPAEGISVWQPWSDRSHRLSRHTDFYHWKSAFLAELSSKRKVAMRFGELMARNACYGLLTPSLKKLMRHEIEVDDLTERDFAMQGMKQSGVDMRIGLDVASMSQSGIVNQVILIAGDTDFLPVAKVARRAGIDFLLDPMGAHVRDDLIENIDGIEDLSTKT